MNFGKQIEKHSGDFMGTQKTKRHSLKENTKEFKDAIDWMVLNKILENMISDTGETAVHLFEKIYVSTDGKIIDESTSPASMLDPEVAAQKFGIKKCKDALLSSIKRAEQYYLDLTDFKAEEIRAAAKATKRSRDAAIIAARQNRPAH